MGLFSSKKKIYVSSTVYNLAGPIEDRMSFLKSSVARAVLTGDHKTSIADEMNYMNLNGPTKDQRAFYRWAKNNYPEGRIEGTSQARQNLDASGLAAVKNVLPIPSGSTPHIRSAFVDSADIAYWAERYVLENQPAEYHKNWVCDYIDDTNEVLITYADNTFTRTPVPDFDPDGSYVVVYYSSSVDVASDNWVNISSNSGMSSRPSTSGANPPWIQDHYSSGYTDVTLTTTTETTTADGTTTSSSTRTESAHVSTEVLKRTVYRGIDPTGLPRTVEDDEVYSIYKSYYVYTTTDSSSSEDSSGNTTTTTTTTEHLAEIWSSNTDSQTIYRDDYSESDRVYLYKIGSGNAALDVLQSEINTYSDFYPIIPFRRDNQAINHPDFADTFPQWEKAFEKSIGGDIEDVLEDIEDNENIDDVDHCTLVFGVELNAKQRHAKRYMYEFLKEISLTQASSLTDVQNWLDSEATYADYLVDLQAWVDAQRYESDPLYRTPRPTHQPIKTPDTTTVTIKTPDDLGVTLTHHTKITWLNITETESTGQSKPDVGHNEIWWEILPDLSRERTVSYEAGGRAEGTYFKTIETVDDNINSRLRLHWQYDDNNYRTLDIWGLVHENIIYAGRAVTITGKEAIEDAEETGFILPLHYPTLKKVPYLWANELAISNRILVFNSYKVVKVRWYQRGIFKLLVVIGIALIFPPAAGVLGPSATVGATLGFAAGTTSALLAGAVANALAALVLTMAISEVSIAIFGEKWGRIVAAVVTFAFNIGAIKFDGLSNITLNWGEMMKIDNIMQMTDVLAQSIQGYAVGEMEEIQTEIFDIKEDYESELKKIQDMLYDLVGDGSTYLNPMDLFVDLTDSSDNRSSDQMIGMETSDRFIQRTTLTGSDFIEIQNVMIEDFVDITLTLPAPNT